MPTFDELQKESVESSKDDRDRVGMLRAAVDVFVLKSRWPAHQWWLAPLNDTASEISRLINPFFAVDRYGVVACKLIAKIDEIEIGVSISVRESGDYIYTTQAIDKNSGGLEVSEQTSSPDVLSEQIGSFIRAQLRSRLVRPT